jgi:hypothetical protein
MVVQKQIPRMGAKHNGKVKLKKMHGTAGAGLLTALLV